MGRYINCFVGGEGKIVWKYGFGVQNSEMHRIYDELGIGEYKLVKDVDSQEDNLGKITNRIYEYTDDWREADCDVLILTRSDIPKLEEKLAILKAESNDEWYIGMIEAIRDFTIEHPDLQEFVFEGEW
ncbi:hypothetical protein H6S82_10520 [Planktothrix sp. FACHB-1355]|uniref:Uncharacterized protein n=1 Tax=Aerosakkonema funiforme FACHB-1375 TaxID=2949571 RepID=A0A926ZHW5_9CYAN|nr:MULTISPECIES: hypothetical protein [Oscillatoriales]MBD2183069.1 hypothetical protein [Aerosakkonema funiforme FACHB-1375]MBD3559294.1 hypothetical protein [Planktothrix sp. FACHB-1355]